MGGGRHSLVNHQTVPANCDSSIRICQSKQFGPVVPIITFDDDREVHDRVINSSVGQQAPIFGADARRMSGLIDPLVNQVCRVNINSQCQRGPDTFPFTGRKDSAEGTLSVTEALRVFCIRSVVAAKTTAEDERLITHIASNRCISFLSTDFIMSRRLRC
jgi:glyceraldehyde-3-phosphate dehydrogenase (NADP+)